MKLPPRHSLSALGAGHAQLLISRGFLHLPRFKYGLSVICMYFVIWLWNQNSYVLEKWYDNWSFSIKLRIRITIWSDQNETRVIHCFHCYSCSRVELSQSVECPQQHDLCMVYQKLQAFMIAARILNMIGSAHRKKSWRLAADPLFVV